MLRNIHRSDKMRAFVMRGHGDLSQLEIADVPAPKLVSDRDVKVKLQAAALNHLDLWTLKGLPGLAISFPHILGGDGAGVVETDLDCVDLGACQVPGGDVLPAPSIVPSQVQEPVIAPDPEGASLVG